MATSSSAGAVAEERHFDCYICLATATSAVVSMCGHLFCWPCLHQWLELKPSGQQLCPVCKSAISRDKVIPLYGRGGDHTDPRDQHLPPRPPGQRTEAPQQYDGNRGSLNVFIYAPLSLVIGDQIFQPRGRNTAAAVSDRTVDAGETATRGSSISDRTRSRTAGRDRASRSRSPLSRP